MKHGECNRESTVRPSRGQRVGLVGLQLGLLLTAGAVFVLAVWSRGFQALWVGNFDQLDLMVSERPRFGVPSPHLLLSLGRLFLLAGASLCSIGLFAWLAGALRTLSSLPLEKISAVKVTRLVSNQLISELTSTKLGRFTLGGALGLLCLTSINVVLGYITAVLSQR